MFYLLINFGVQCQASQLYNFDPSILPTLGIFVPQNGFNKYAQNAITEVEGYIEKASVPEIDFAVSSFKFKLSDIHVSDVSIQKIDVSFPDQDQRAQLNISLCNLQFTFDMMEQIYPYIKDNGQGFLYISNIIVDVIANPVVEGATEDMCYPYQHLNPQFSNNSYMTVQDVKISFDSQYSYIYNGIMELLQDTIIDLVNEQLGPQILFSALDAAIDGISGGWCVSRIDSNASYGTSMIYQDFKVEDQMFKIQMSGQYSDLITNEAGVEDIYFYGENNTNLQTYLLTNADFLYFIEKQNWETGVQLNLAPQLNKDIKCIKYVNNGALIAYGESVYLVKFLEQNNLLNCEKLSVKVLLDQHYGCLDQNMNINISDDCQLTDDELQLINNFYDVNYFTLANSYGNDHCDFKYQDDNNMLMSCYQEA